MKNNIKIISIIIFSILSMSCGFEKINQNYKPLINIVNIDIIGDKGIGYNLKNNILLISDKNAKSRYEIIINIKQNKSVKTKDSTGKVTRYNMILSVKLELKNIETLEIISRSFTKNDDYNIFKSHSDTISDKNNTSKNLVKLISDDIINFITLSIEN